jgi:hypothetical protein
VKAVHKARQIRKGRSARRCSDIPTAPLRLQTLDQGAPVSVFTVVRELGHGGETMVRKVYGHLGQVRQRSAVLEYRAEAFADRLGARLEALRQVGFGTTIGTTP